MPPESESPWSRPEVVTGFTQTPPNRDLLRFAARERRAGSPQIALDLGCGAGRNAVPLAQDGWRVLGVDTSIRMVQAAKRLSREHDVHDRVHAVIAAMNALPSRNASVDLLVAHGIWNLARSDEEFRQAVREAARVARPGAGLFVFTFSRTTLPSETRPVAGETFVFTQFSGQRQCFLTSEQLVSELARASFVPDASMPLIELNRSTTQGLQLPQVPVIHQGAFRRVT
jgi:SAM-dependent methyltransferase